MELQAEDRIRLGLLSGGMGQEGVAGAAGDTCQDGGGP